MHSGDNLTGEGEGDDEVIKVDQSKVSANISKIDFTVTIYKAESHGQVSNAFIRIVNEETGDELVRYLSRTGRKRNLHLGYGRVRNAWAFPYSPGDLMITNHYVTVTGNRRPHQRKRRSV